MKAVLFDLDDTLYPEYTFLESGYKAVAVNLSRQFSLDKREVFQRLIEISEENGRGKVFDILLEGYNLYSPQTVRQLVSLYRTHKPDIQLFEDVRETLKELRAKGSSLGIITDGMVSVQKKKVKTLNIEGLFDCIIYTGELGKEFCKPSTVPFKKALDALNVEPGQSVYVADNPAKDFLGPHILKMATIQIRRESQRRYVREESTEYTFAQATVNHIKDIVPIIFEGGKD